MQWNWPLTIDKVREWFTRLATPGGAQEAFYGADRAARLARQYNAYAGTFPPALAPTKADPFARDNVSENVMADVVDTGVSMVVGKGVTFQLGDGGGDTPEAEYLAEAWRRNKLDSLLHAAALHGAVAGDVFLKVLMPPGSDYPRVVALDPRVVDVQHDPDDRDLVVEVCIRGERQGDRGKTVLTRQRIFRTVLPAADDSGEVREGVFWQIVDEESLDGGRTWMGVGAPAVWPLPWCPVQHAQGNPNPSGYYGTADLTPDLLKLNEDLNFVTSNVKRVVRHYGHPILYAVGVQASQLVNEPGKMICLPGGGVGGAGGGGGARIDAVDIPSSIPDAMAFARYLKESIYQRARTPDVSSRMEKLGQISGTALKVLYAPLISKTLTKQQLLGDLLERVSVCLLELGGWADREVTASWPDPTPANDQERAETAVLHEQLGIVSKQTLAAQFNFNYAKEKVLIEAERREEKNLGGALLSDFNRGDV
jgi:hypothetical protein